MPKPASSMESVFLTPSVTKKRVLAENSLTLSMADKKTAPATFLSSILFNVNISIFQLIVIFSFVDFILFIWKKRTFRRM
jgi:hypothetical protein